MLGAGSWLLGAGSWLLGAGSWELAAGSWELGAGSCWELAAGSWELGAGCWELFAGAGSWELAAGSWELGAGCWELGAGCWELGAGSWELVLPQPQWRRCYANPDLISDTRRRLMQKVSTRGGCGACAPQKKKKTGGNHDAQRGLSSVCQGGVRLQRHSVLHHVNTRLIHQRVSLQFPLVALERKLLRMKVLLLLMASCLALHHGEGKCAIPSH